MEMLYKGYAIVKKSSYILYGPSNDRQFNKFQTFRTKKAAIYECRKDEKIVQCEIILKIT